jgi:large repetitive protein
VVGITSSDAAVISVEPETVSIPEGETSGAFSISALREGAVVITAEAPGYADAMREVGGTNTTVSIGSIPLLAPGESRSLPISLSEPAPPAGVTILLESTDPTVAAVQPAVFVAGGSFVPAANAQVTGVAAGSTVINARTEGFAPDARAATVQLLSISISPSPLALFEEWEHTATVSLSRPAPEGGLRVTLTSLDPAVFTVPDEVIVAEGQTSRTFTATGGSSGTTSLVAAAPGTASVTVPVQVTPSPDIRLAAGTVLVGRDLQAAQTVSLARAPTEPVTITLEVPEGSGVLLSMDRTAAGATSITIPDVFNTGNRTFYVQGLAQGAVAQIRARASGYNDATSTVNVMGSGFHLVTSSITTTVFAGNSTITLGSYRHNADGSFSASTHAQEVRGGITAYVPVASADQQIGSITVSPVPFAGGTGSSKQTHFDPHSDGAVVITLEQPDGFVRPSNGRSSLTATVNTPNVRFSTSTVAVGRDLQAALSVSLQSEPPEPVSITVSVPASSGVLLSASRTAVGSASITLENVGNAANRTIYVQGISEGTVTLRAEADGYNDATATATVMGSGFHLITSSITTTVFAANTSISVGSYRLNADGSFSTSTHGQEVRAGVTVAVPVTSDDPEIGSITVSPVVFAGGTGSTKSTQFNPHADGTVVVRLEQPHGFAGPGNGRSALTATVNTPNVRFSSAGVAVGRDLQAAVGVSLQSAPPEAVSITISVPENSGVLLSPSRTAVGSPSMTIANVTNTASRTIYVQGVAAGTVTLRASAEGYVDATMTATVSGSGFHLVTSAINTTVFSGNSNITAGTYRLNEDGSFSTSTHGQELRAGVTVEVPVVSMDPVVGSITVSPLVFVGGSGQTKTTHFNPHTDGTTQVVVTQPDGFALPTNGRSALTATVNTPDVLFGTGSVVVGRDLQTALTVRLQQAPPEPVTITVSVPEGSGALLSTTRTGVGSSSVTFTGVTSTASRTIYVQGLSAGATTTALAQAAGYNDAQSHIAVTRAGFHITTSSITTTVGAADSNIGVTAYRVDMNGAFSTSTHAQEVRGGMTVNLAVSSSDEAVGTIASPSLSFAGGSGASKTARFRPLSAGTTLIAITQPPDFVVPFSSRQSFTATVNP